MIITISGVAGSGKSTVAKLIAEKLKIKHYSSGDLMRHIAKERGISLLKLSKAAEKDKSIDRELDERQIKLGKTEDNFIIDGRLSAKFIPNAKFKIFLDCSDSERAKRILNDKREGDNAKTVDQMIEKIKTREESENKTDKKYYDYDYHNSKNYTHVIDTTNTNIEGVLKEILNIIKGKDL